MYVKYNIMIELRADWSLSINMKISSLLIKLFSGCFTKYKQTVLHIDKEMLQKD